MSFSGGKNALQPSLIFIWEDRIALKKPILLSTTPFFLHVSSLKWHVSNPNKLETFV